MDDLRERMRESVAQAIATNAGDCSLEEMIPTFRDQYLSDADAAITALLDAIREPDEHLMQLGAVAAGDAAEVLDADLAFGAGFTAMIDHLREKMDD